MNYLRYNNGPLRANNITRITTRKFGNVTHQHQKNFYSSYRMNNDSGNGSNSSGGGKFRKYLLLGVTGSVVAGGAYLYYQYLGNKEFMFSSSLPTISKDNIDTVNKLFTAATTSGSQSPSIDDVSSSFSDDLSNSDLHHHQNNAVVLESSSEHHTVADPLVNEDQDDDEQNTNSIDILEPTTTTTTTTTTTVETVPTNDRDPINDDEEVDDDEVPTVSVLEGEKELIKDILFEDIKSIEPVDTISEIFNESLQLQEEMEKEEKVVESEEEQQQEILHPSPTISIKQDQLQELLKDVSDRYELQIKLLIEENLNLKKEIENVKINGEKEGIELKDALEKKYQELLESSIKSINDEFSKKVTSLHEYFKDNIDSNYTLIHDTMKKQKENLVGIFEQQSKSILQSESEKRLISRLSQSILDLQQLLLSSSSSSQQSLKSTFNHLIKNLGELSQYDKMIESVSKTLPFKLNKDTLLDRQTIYNRFLEVAKDCRHQSLLPPQVEDNIVTNALKSIAEKFIIPEKGMAPGTDTDSTLARAEEFLKQGQLDQAIKEVESVAKSDKKLQKITNQWLKHAKERSTGSLPPIPAFKFITFKLFLLEASTIPLNMKGFIQFINPKSKYYEWSLVSFAVSFLLIRNVWAYIVTFDVLYQTAQRFSELPMDKSIIFIVEAFISMTLNLHWGVLLLKKLILKFKGVNVHQLTNPSVDFYDLNYFSFLPYGYNYNGYQYEISFCQPTHLVDCPGVSNTTQSCLIDPNGKIDSMGNFNNLEISYKTIDKFSLTYRDSNYSKFDVQTNAIITPETFLEDFSSKFVQKAPNILSFNLTKFSTNIISINNHTYDFKFAFDLIIYNYRYDPRLDSFMITGLFSQYYINTLMHKCFFVTLGDTDFTDKIINFDTNGLQIPIRDYIDNNLTLSFNNGFSDRFNSRTFQVYTNSNVTLVIKSLINNIDGTLGNASCTYCIGGILFGGKLGTQDNIIRSLNFSFIITDTFIEKNAIYIQSPISNKRSNEIPMQPEVITQESDLNLNFTLFEGGDTFYFKLYYGSQNTNSEVYIELFLEFENGTIYKFNYLVPFVRSNFYNYTLRSPEGFGFGNFRVYKVFNGTKEMIFTKPFSYPKLEIVSFSSVFASQGGTVSIFGNGIFYNPIVSLVYQDDYTYFCSNVQVISQRQLKCNLDSINLRPGIVDNDFFSIKITDLEQSYSFNYFVFLPTWFQVCPNSCSKQGVCNLVDQVCSCPRQFGLVDCSLALNETILAFNAPYPINNKVNAFKMLSSRPVEDSSMTNNGKHKIIPKDITIESINSGFIPNSGSGNSNSNNGKDFIGFEIEIVSVRETNQLGKNLREVPVKDLNKVEHDSNQFGFQFQGETELVPGPYRFFNKMTTTVNYHINHEYRFIKFGKSISLPVSFNSASIEMMIENTSFLSDDNLYEFVFKITNSHSNVTIERRDNQAYIIKADRPGGDHFQITPSMYYIEEKGYYRGDVKTKVLDESFVGGNNFTKTAFIAIQIPVGSDSISFATTFNLYAIPTPPTPPTSGNLIVNRT
eukprot:gene451-571_t